MRERSGNGGGEELFYIRRRLSSLSAEREAIRAMQPFHEENFIVSGVPHDKWRRRKKKYFLDFFFPHFSRIFSELIE